VPRSKISILIQEQIRQRAQYLCEFCHANEQWQYVKFTVDHIVPLSLGGSDRPENLALACFHCNRRKTNRLAAMDLQSATEVPLFNVQPGSPALYPLRMSVGMKGERIDDCSRAAQRTAFEV
jgi:HNH endonuclease